jgi:hypothetical protein
VNPPPIRIVALAALLAARTWAADAGTMRAADAGVSPGFCPTLRAVVDAAGSGFSGLRGTVRAGGENAWEGTKRFPGGGDCVVFGGSPPAYACTLYLGDVEENADGTYDRAVSGVKDCLGAAWKTSEKSDGTHARTTVAQAGSGPSLRVVSRDASGDAYLVELWVDGAK